MTNSTLQIPEKQLTGDLAVWFFIFAELTVFAIFFIGYTWMKSQNLELFANQQQTLHPVAGLINTLALISSSYFVAVSVVWVRKRDYRRSQKALLMAIAIAAIYIVTKVWEYSELVGAGYGLSSNDFHMFYFLITGFHFMHVMLGILVLILLTRSLGKAAIATEDEQCNTRLNMESGASYWHMLDLVWLILFPLIYVI